MRSVQQVFRVLRARMFGAEQAVVHVESFGEERYCFGMMVQGIEESSEVDQSSATARRVSSISSSVLKMPGERRACEGE